MNSTLLLGKILGFLCFCWNSWVALCCYEIIWSCIAFFSILLIISCECCSLHWVFAHDAILFCTSHAYSFPCIALLFFIPFLRISSAVFLCLFVLLFSFSNMAPKKSRPSKNPISHHGSSYSSSLPSLPTRDRFCDSKSQKNFDENFSDRAIHSEQRVILSDFPNTPLLVHLALGVGNLYARNPRGVLACLYRSSTPAYRLSIPLFPSLLQYSKENVS